jgi:DNA-directed RNA polymerase I, II, and III subunit RPABC5
MLIPVKCFTCGKVLANKWEFYVREVRKIKLEQNLDENEVIYLTSQNVKKTAEGIVLDQLNLTRMCCRRHMLTHVDIE